MRINGYGNTTVRDERRLDSPAYRERRAPRKEPGESETSLFLLPAPGADGAGLRFSESGGLALSAVCCTTGGSRKVMVTKGFH